VEACRGAPPLALDSCCPASQRGWLVRAAHGTVRWEPPSPLPAAAVHVCDAPAIAAAAALHTRLASGKGCRTHPVARRPGCRSWPCGGSRRMPPWPLCTHQLCAFRPEAAAGQGKPCPMMLPLADRSGPSILPAHDPSQPAFHGCAATRLWQHHRAQSSSTVTAKLSSPRLPFPHSGQVSRWVCPTSGGLGSWMSYSSSRSSSSCAAGVGFEGGGRGF